MNSLARDQSQLDEMCQLRGAPSMYLRYTNLFTSPIHVEIDWILVKLLELRFGLTGRKGILYVSAEVWNSWTRQERDAAVSWSLLQRDADTRYRRPLRRFLSVIMLIIFLTWQFSLAGEPTFMMLTGFMFMFTLLALDLLLKFTAEAWAARVICSGPDQNSALEMLSSGARHCHQARCRQYFQWLIRAGSNGQ